MLDKFCFFYFLISSILSVMMLLASAFLGFRLGGNWIVGMLCCFCCIPMTIYFRPGR